MVLFYRYYIDTTVEVLWHMCRLLAATVKKYTPLTPLMPTQPDLDLLRPDLLEALRIARRHRPLQLRHLVELRTPNWLMSSARSGIATGLGASHHRGIAVALRRPAVSKGAVAQSGPRSSRNMEFAST